MSKSISIEEGGKNFNFGGLDLIETETTDEGGSCFWVPESERELETAFVMSNGDYTPEKYAFGELYVDIIEPIGDFDITIDEDGFPDIIIDDGDIDLTIDPDGLPEIIIDIHVHTIDDDTIGIDIPPDTELKIDAPKPPAPPEPVIIPEAIEINFNPTIDPTPIDPPGEWSITALTDVTVEDIGYPPGAVVKTWPSTEHVDFYIKAGLAIPDISDLLDPDGDIDISIDPDGDIDISGIDLDGLPIDIHLDFPSFDMDLFELPDEIRIMHVPNKTSYKDGEVIDLDGLVVQAYRGGEAWGGVDGKYVGGYIPAHELIIDPTTATKGDMHYSDDIPTYTGGTFTFSYTGKKYDDRGQVVDFTRIVSFQFPEDVCWTPFWFGEDDIGVIFATLTEGENVAFSQSDEFFAESYNRPINLSFYHRYDIPGFWSYFVHLANKEATFPHDYELWDYSEHTIGPYVEYAEDVAYKLLYGKITPVNNVSISWPRPHDNKILTSSFKITIEESEGGSDSGSHGGSHHSGKF